MLFFVLTSIYLPPRADVLGITLSVTVVFSEEVHNFFTSSSFDETLTNPNGTSFDIDIPAFALSSGEQIEMEMLSLAESFVIIDKPLLSDKLAADTFYDISFMSLSDSSAVSSFDKDITLTFNYTNDDISGIDESTLAAYRWDGSEWLVLSGSTVNTAANTVTAASRQFSVFSLQGSAPSSDDDSSGDDTSGGGGGGGGTYTPPGAEVFFFGMAYPESDVTLLRNAQVVATTRAGLDAKFQISLDGLSAGTHTFSVWSEDKKGHRSITHSFTVSVTRGVTTNISGIFLPPTISADKSEVRRGDPLMFLGYSAPRADVTVFVNSNEEIVKTVKSTQSGAWAYQLDTALLSIGDHTSRARAVKDDTLTTFSQVIGFVVGTKNVQAIASKEVSKGDVNNDERVNLIDFSITAFWYKRENPPQNVDLNGDGTVNLVDFSILAFYWTG